jgi:hypothetical protein
MAFDLRGSYFAIGNPLNIFLGWLHPYRYCETVSLNGHELEVSWTRRADKSLQQRSHSLLVEMQLYFSCVVQKRVLFHNEDDNDYVVVNKRLRVCFHPVEAEACDPELFASQHPARRVLNSRSATRMHPRQLLIDYRKGQWRGEFSI